MIKPAETSVELNPILTHRWSPRSFSPEHQVENEDLTAILEAARWSPSANNLQPWRFLVARKGEENFEKISNLLSGFNAVWAPNASLFLVIVANTLNSDGSSNSYALYDCGIASANATVEAHHRGLAVHQMAGFDGEKLAEEFKLKDGQRPLSILVIGKQAPADLLPDATLRNREVASRQRLPLNDLLIGTNEFVL